MISQPEKIPPRIGENEPGDHGLKLPVERFQCPGRVSTGYLMGSRRGVNRGFGLTIGAGRSPFWTRAVGWF